MTATTRARRLARLAMAVAALPLAGAVAPVSTAPAAAAATTTATTAGADGRWLVSDTDTGGATVTCPLGTKVFGLGAEVDGGSAFIRELMPSASLTSATVTASAPVAATVHAVCKPPAAGMTRVASSGAAGTAVATCPTGTTLYGTGVNIHQQHGNVFVTQLTPDLSPPTATVALNAEVPVTAYAICGAPAHSTHVAEAQELAVGSSKTVQVVCPAGTHVQSPGAGIKSSSNVVLDEVTINRSLTKAKVTAHSATPGRWVMDAYAVCVD